MPANLRYLNFDVSDNADGVTTLDAMASTGAGEHAAVLAEAQQVLDWAWAQFPHSHGAADDGMDWDHDLQVQTDDAGEGGSGGRWRTVTLTLTGSARFVQAFFAAFGAPDDD